MHSKGIGVHALLLWAHPPKREESGEEEKALPVMLEILCFLVFFGWFGCLDYNIGHLSGCNGYKIYQMRRYHNPILLPKLGFPQKVRNQACVLMC